jgi:carbonic anhydrase
MKDCNCIHANDLTTPELKLGRRTFLKLGVLGAGMSMFFSASPARASGGTDALLLSCMDYRLVDDLVKFMDGKNMTDKYDHVVLAGASAGATHEKFAAWHETFWSHLQVAIDLHKIRKVMVIDHRDCGAYKIALGKDHLKDAETEREAHAKILNILAQEIHAKYPQLAIETYLMAVDGGVEEINQAA